MILWLIFLFLFVILPGQSLSVFGIRDVLLKMLYPLFFLDYLHKVLHWSSSSAFPLHPIFPIPEPREAESYRGGLPFYFGLHLCSPKYFRTKGSSVMPSPGPSPGTFKGLKSVLISCRVLVSWPNAHSLKKEKWFFFFHFFSILILICLFYSASWYL